MLGGKWCRNLIIDIAAWITMNFWSDILSSIQNGENICLLYVLESEGSSPGRQCFKMYVSDTGELKGSIGGGFMEQKLVELAKSLLNKKETKPFIKHQVHRNDVARNKSGMICSGEQVVAFYFLNESHIKLIKQISEASQGELELTESGMFFNDKSDLSSPFCKILNDQQWIYKEAIQLRDTIYIIGGGHVSLALSQTMNQLGFQVIILDNRENLNTMEQNIFAHKKHIIDYEEADKHIPEGENNYVALVSFGFKTDEVVLRKIIRNKYKYLGMMGSKEKIKELFKNMLNDGFSQEEIDKVSSPIGLPINSKTTFEIAVSIAAEIIQVKYNQS